MEGAPRDGSATRIHKKTKGIALISGLRPRPFWSCIRDIPLSCSHDDFARAAATNLDALLRPFHKQIDIHYLGPRYKGYMTSSSFKVHEIGKK